MLGIFFIIPFGTMLAISFFHRIEGALLRTGLRARPTTPDFCSPVFGRALGFSLLLAGIAALISVAIAFPFTYLMTRMRRRVQVRWLVFILAVLSLSEVIIGFAWSTLLSRTAGLSNILVWIGLLEPAAGLEPRLPGAADRSGAMSASPTACWCSIRRCRASIRQLPEASRMLGASPLRSLFQVVVPVLRANSIVSA